MIRFSWRRTTGSCAPSMGSNSLAYPCTRTVDNHILRLRKKLEPEPAPSQTPSNCARHGIQVLATTVPFTNLFLRMVVNFFTRTGGVRAATAKRPVSLIENWPNRDNERYGDASTVDPRKTLGRIRKVGFAKKSLQVLETG